MTLSNRQFVNESGCEIMTPVKITVRVLSLQPVHILAIVIGAARIVRHMSPGIGDLISQSALKTPVETDLKRVVPGLGRGFSNDNRRVPGIGTSPKDRIDPVDIAVAEQMQCAASHVSDLEHRLRFYQALEVQVELLCQWQDRVRIKTEDRARQLAWIVGRGERISQVRIKSSD